MTPTRILHVVGGMNRAGVETWLVHVLRHVDRTRFHMDFLVHSEYSGALDAEIREMGSDVIPCLYPRQPIRYARNFARIVRQHGPYDILHSHVHHYSGVVVLLARRAGIPHRVVQSHIDTSSRDTNATVSRRAYLRSMQWLIRRYATRTIAASIPAGRSLFGHDWEPGDSSRVLRYGIDLESFDLDLDPAAIRDSLGLPDGAFVVGHIGRFAHQKNHEFLIELFGKVRSACPEAYLLLVGDGELRHDIERQVESIGLGERVVFAGERGDVPRLLTGAMDVFVFPSRFEGLPVALLEAQAAGLPCVVSDTIAEDATVIPSLVQRLTLGAPVDEWVSAIVHARGAPKEETCAIFARSPFNVVNGARNLERLYDGLE
jgi:glycosyltransferase involved in cell wall biosynthesis